MYRAPILLHHAFQMKKQGNSCLARAEQHLGFWLGTSSQTLFSFWNSVKQMLWKFPRKKTKINPGYVFILLSWNSQQCFFRFFALPKLLCIQTSLPLEHLLCSTRAWIPWKLSHLLQAGSDLCFQSAPQAVHKACAAVLSTAPMPLAN